MSLFFQKNKNKDIGYSILAGVIVLIVTYFILYFLNLVPNELRFFDFYGTAKDSFKEEKFISNKNFDIPDKIVIPKIGVDSVVGHPSSAETSVLDEYLKKGSVYYPGSGNLGEGNIYIFGHSTNWKVVQNPAYKTFNGLEDLQNGDEIELYAKGVKYVYTVDSKELVNDSEAWVDLSETSKRLTISTCNTFGKKEERWIVTASIK